MTVKNLSSTRRCGVWRVALAVSLASLGAGCSNNLATDYSDLGLAEVSGTVTLDGEPVPGAHIAFEDDQKRYSYGVTDSSGRYSLMFNSEKSGVMPGPKTVKISTRAATAEEGESLYAGAESDMGAGEEELPSPSAVEKIPACYYRDSKIRVVVDEGSQTIDFELKSDCSTDSAT